MKRESPIALALLVLLHGAVLASGGSPMPGPSTPSSMPESAPLPRMTPEEQAMQMYNDGLHHEEKAKKLSGEAETAEPKKRSKLEEQAQKEYLKAIKSFHAALDRNPALFQAHSGMGYALRKTGNYAEALDAYDQALKLEPRYSPAIEYQAEAYLSLNRLEEAKAAYMNLFNADRKRADELHAAMKKWLAARRQDAAGVAPQTIEEFAAWVAEREEIAGHTSSLLRPADDRW